MRLITEDTKPEEFYRKREDQEIDLTIHCLDGCIHNCDGCSIVKKSDRVFTNEDVDKINKFINNLGDNVYCSILTIAPVDILSIPNFDELLDTIQPLADRFKVINITMAIDFKYSYNLNKIKRIQRLTKDKTFTILAPIKYSQLKNPKYIDLVNSNIENLINLFTLNDREKNTSLIKVKFRLNLNEYLDSMANDNLVLDLRKYGINTWYNHFAYIDITDTDSLCNDLNTRLKLKRQIELRSKLLEGEFREINQYRSKDSLLDEFKKEKENRIHDQDLLDLDRIETFQLDSDRIDINNSIRLRLHYLNGNLYTAASISNDFFLNDKGLSIPIPDSREGLSELEAKALAYNYSVLTEECSNCRELEYCVRCNIPVVMNHSMIKHCILPDYIRKYIHLMDIKRENLNLFYIDL